MKLLWIAAPLGLYALSVAIRAAMGRRPSRHALNVELAVVLVVYFLATAGLGLFWVANQQLPPFDLHYLFGYATLALVLVHVAFNARIVVGYLRRGQRSTPKPLGSGVWLRAAGFVVVAAVAFFLGMRAGSPRIPSSFGGRADASLEAMGFYHSVSTHTRTGVLVRAPSVAWDLPVAPHIDRSGLPRVNLPAADPKRGVSRNIVEGLSATPAERGRAFDLADLALVVWAASGITSSSGGYDFRAAASSGALFPTEIYVMVWTVDGIAPGTYAYSPKEHALFDLGRAPTEHPAFGLEDEPTFAIVATSVFRRTGQKYRDRAYRYAVADAGHSLGNAIVAAADLGCNVRVVPRFDEARVAAQIGVDNATEGVVAVVEMRANGGTPRTAASDGRFRPSTLPVEEELALGATSLVHAATSLTWVEPVSADGGEAASWPKPSPVAARVLELAAKRRSVRKFRGGDLSVASLSTVLAAAAGAPPLAFGGANVYLVANRVDALADGTYRYDAGKHALQLVRSGDFAAEAGRAALDQEVVGDAALVVVVTLDKRALEAAGARGYRYGFLEAGFVGARLYLAAQAVALGGCSVGAFYDEETAALLGIDLEREWPVHFFALGEPA